MRAVLLRVRASLRRRSVSTLLIACIVAVVSGAVLALTAGAHRTSAAPDAYTASVGGDATAIVQQSAGPPLTAKVAALPGVESVRAMTFLFAAITDPKHVQQENAISFAGSPAVTSRLVAGRFTDPKRPNEFVADRSFVIAEHAHVGDRFPFVSWTPNQAAHGQGFNGPPKGPSFTALLVGITDTPDQLAENYDLLVFSPALLDKPVGISATIMTVHGRPGVTTARLRRELDDGVPHGNELSLDTGRILSAEIRNAVQAQALGTWLMAGVACIAALIALGQLLTRQARLSETERRPLLAVGFTRSQIVTESLLHAAVPVATGVVGGIAIAVAVSRSFPVGFVRSLEPNPGRRFDGLALLGGGAVLLVGVLAWVAIALLPTRRTRARRGASGTSEAIAKRAPSPSAATGVRFALSSDSGSSAVATGTLVVLALIVGGIAGSTAFAASVDRLVTDRGRWGSNYTWQVGDNSDLTPKTLKAALAHDPDISGMMILTQGSVRSGRITVDLAGLERVKGNLEPRVTAGRLPSAPDEIALGRVTAGQLHAKVGDDLPLAGSGAGHHGTYRVVGLAVVPSVGGMDGVGKGGVVTSDGLLRLEPQPSAALAAFVLHDGPSASARSHIKALTHFDPGPEAPPASIVNVGRVRRIPTFLAALLAALLLMTLFHTVVVSIQNRRRDVAILRALGADRSWIGSAVHWQTSVLTALPLAIGVPLGLVAGAVVFRVFTNRIGALPDPSIPFVLIAVMMLGLVVVANVVAVVPSRRARRLSTAALLKVE